MIKTELLKGSLTTLILAALQTRDMYGYDLIKELEALSGGLLEVKEGTIYPLLHALEKSKAIDAYWQSPAGERRRKYYRLSKAGKKMLSERSADWRTFRKFMDQALVHVKLVSHFTPEVL